MTLPRRVPRGRERVKLLVALCILCLLAVPTNSCDPMTSVTLFNETSEQLAFYLQSDVQAALLGTELVDAGASFQEWMIAADYIWLRVAATREDGEWVFDHTYTKNELEGQRRMVVVSSLEPVAPPAGVRVIPRRDAPDPVVPPVIFVNETQQKLEFYTKSDVEATLAGTMTVRAGSSLEWGKFAPNFAWVRVAATREDGEWVFEQMYTWDQLQMARRTIVVSSLDPIAPPANVRILPRPDVPPPILPPAATAVVPGEAPTAASNRQATQTPP